MDMYKIVSPGVIGHGKSFKEAADLITKAGFEGYSFSPQGDFTIPVEEAQEIIQRYQMKPGAFNLPIEFRKDVDTFENEFEKFKDYVKYAADIGLKRCITWILPGHNEYDFDTNYKIHKTRLKKCAEVLRDYDMLFGLEFIGPPRSRRNAKYPFLYDLDGMLGLCDDINTGNCGILMDIWHWDLAGQTREDFKKFTHADQVVLVHINDAPEGVSPEDQVDGIRKLPGETGVLRIGEFFNGLKSIGYTGPVMAEPFEAKLKEMAFEDALAATIKAINKVWPG
jgi:sugar phosphate isomerase/epimerase